MTSVADPAHPRPRGLDRRRAIALGLSLALLTMLSWWRLAPAPATTVHDLAGLTMGTTYSLRIDADLTATDLENVRDVVQSRLDEVEDLMSTYDSTSELSRFNLHGTTDPYPASDALLEVLSMARNVSDRSGGAFDVTVAALVDAWGFGPGQWPERTPDPALIEELGTRVGYERIIVDREAGTVHKTHPETVVDLSAIAKGYAVERVASALEGLGLSSFLVEVGGELRAGGVKRDGTAWRIGIESPEAAGRSVYATVDVVGKAIATSGDYRNFYEEDGVRYAHIIDPRSGQPVRYSGASVTVLHDDCAIADAWATALSVVGPDAGYDLALREGIAALFVMRSPEGVRSRTTPTFLEHVSEYTEVAAR